MVRVLDFVFINRVWYYSFLGVQNHFQSNKAKMFPRTRPTKFVKVHFEFEHIDLISLLDYRTYRTFLIGCSRKLGCSNRKINWGYNTTVYIANKLLWFNYRHASLKRSSMGGHHLPSVRSLGRHFQFWFKQFKVVQTITLVLGLNLIPLLRAFSRY